MFSKYHLVTYRNQDSLEKWLIQELEQRNIKMSLEHLGSPGSKEAVEVHWGHIKGTQSLTQKGFH